MCVRRFFRALLSMIVLSVPTFATDGMSLEGWGPVSTSMGGASMAYNNGMAALMNNPATLMFLPRGEIQFDLSLTQLGPGVTATVNTPNGSYLANSSSDAFYMPAIGWGKHHGKFAYAFGMFAQGGMGCEYDADSWMGRPWLGVANYDHALVNRSEVSVGRLLGAVAYEVNPRFTIAGSLDFVWAGLDLQMGMSQGQFFDMINPQAQTLGYADGSLMQGFGAMFEPFGGYGVRQFNYAYFDFSNGSDFTGQARGYGYAAKLGFLWKATDNLNIGGSYHTETVLDDLKTSRATMSMGVNMDVGLLTTGTPSGVYQDVVLPLAGEISVIDFQWPTTVSLGFAWTHGPLMLVGDVKQLMWSDVMNSFDMAFTADETPENGPFGGMALNAGLYQNWDDQTVLAFGGAYGFKNGITLRAGMNLTGNPIPDNYVNPLFPAIIEKHAMLGVGFDIGAGELNLVGVNSFENEVTSLGNGTNIPPVTSTHDQFNWSLQYSWKY